MPLLYERPVIPNDFRRPRRCSDWKGFTVLAYVRTKEKQVGSMNLLKHESKKGENNKTNEYKDRNIS